MEFRKYDKIRQLGDEENKDIFTDGEDMIYIQEKVDGGNFRFYVSEEGNLIFGSRNQQLTSSEGEDTNIQKNFMRCINHVRCALADKDLTEYKGLIFYGECLHGDTIIHKAGGGKGDKANSMTIKEMYNYSKSKLPDRKSTWWQKNGMPSLYSLDIHSGKILPNKMVNVIKTGVRSCFEINTRLGYNIKCSDSHPILTNNGFISISEGLKEGDCIGISDLTKKRKKRNLGKGTTKIIKSQKDYVIKIGKCEECESASSLELHHIDGDFRNNNSSNFKCLCRECHKKINVEKNRKKEYEYFFDSITSIDYTGEEEMYDIQMSAPNDNFLANNIIVHNCMIKHTIGYDWENTPSFLGFDIFDTLSDRLISVEGMYGTYNNLGLDTVPLIKTILAKDIKDFTDEDVPKSKFYGGQAEGVVIKNSIKHVYAKYVRDAFKEKNRKEFGMNKKHTDTDEDYFTAVYCTNARVEKIVWKLIDDGNKLHLSMMPLLIKAVYKDIWEENWNEIVTTKQKTVSFDKLKKAFTQRCFVVLKNIITNNAINQKKESAKPSTIKFKKLNLIESDKVRQPFKYKKEEKE